MATEIETFFDQALALGPERLNAICSEFIGLPGYCQRRR